MFAANDGIIEEVPVEDGQTVTAGQVVARQRSLDIENEVIRLTGLLRSNREQVGGIMIKLRNPDPRTSHANDISELRNEQSRLEREGESLVLQLEILKQKHDQLEITSPIEGKVVTLKSAN